MSGEGWAVGTGQQIEGRANTKALLQKGVQHPKELKDNVEE